MGGGGIWDVDMSAMNSAQAVAWIVEFQTELRNLLPSPYIISHAPVAPWFTSANDYADGSYVSIHQQVGDTIDFYNVQFYNQGADQYVTCEVSCVKTVSREGIYNTRTVFGFLFSDASHQLWERMAFDICIRNQLLHRCAPG